MTLKNLFFLLYSFILISLAVACSLNTIKEQPTPAITEENKVPNFQLPDIPSSMVFAGQKIILLDEDLKERLDREILVNTYFQSATIQIIKRANRWFPLIEKILKQQNIPDDFKYLAVIESALTQAISPVGAQGFWQFMPETAKEYHLEITDEIDERLDVIKSTVAAAQFLTKSYSTFNDWILVAASYNRGVGGVSRDLSWQKTTHFFDTELNTETARYVFRILAFKLILENPEAYGFSIPTNQLYNPYEVNTFVIENSIVDLNEWALEKGFNFKLLKKLNPWLKSNKLTLKKDKKFNLLLPKNNTNLKPYKEYLK